jgi:hypothetical protein
MNYPTKYPGYIVRTDSMGDTLWTHTYQKNYSQNTVINDEIPLADGRIVAAGYSTSLADAGGIHHITYYHQTPWFMLLDSKGNIIRDTVYSSGYLVGSNICGELYTDMNGGYINIGQFDSLATEYPDDLANFPGYIAHLDTNFRITWLTEFNYSAHYGHRQPVMAKQLQDSSYIVTGDNQTYHHRPGEMGFAAKISKTGKLEWSHTYYSDTLNEGYLRDVAEKPDGSLVFTGQSATDTAPMWHQRYDMWIVGLDSNGCEMPGGCDPDTSNVVVVDTVTEVKNVQMGGYENVKIYPNPMSGLFTIKAAKDGTLTVYNMLGQQLQQYVVRAGETEVQLPAGIAAGMYMGFFKPEYGGMQVLKLVYRP